MFAIEVIKLMNSAEALKKAKAFKPPKRDISALVRIVAKRINEAVEKGKTRLDDEPLAGLRLLVSAKDRMAVYDHLRANGYTVKGGIVSWGKKR